MGQHFGQNLQALLGCFVRLDNPRRIATYRGGRGGVDVLPLRAGRVVGRRHRDLPLPGRHPQAREHLRRPERQRKRRLNFPAALRADDRSVDDLVPGRVPQGATGQLRYSSFTHSALSTSKLRFLVLMKTFVNCDAADAVTLNDACDCACAAANSNLDTSHRASCHSFA